MPEKQISDAKYYREVTKQRKRERYASDPGYRAMVLKRLRESYARNRAKRLAVVAAYWESNKDKIKVYQKTYRSTEGYRVARNAASARYRANPANRPILALRSSMAAANRRNAPGLCTREQLNSRIEYYAGKCWVCSGVGTEIDHVQPVTKGGSNWPGNLRPICRSCNATKSNKWPLV